MRFRFLLSLCFGTSSVCAGPAVSYKNYETLQGSGGLGSAFVTECDGVYYAVTSIHQFEGEKPGIEDASGKPLALLVGPTKRFNDIQVWELLDQSGTQPFLPYEEQFSLKNGELLAVRSLVGDVVLGETLGLGLRAYLSKEGSERLILRLKEPLDAAGLSGSPICKVSNGKVVGVLVGADKPQGARELVFETLHLTNPFSREGRKIAVVERAESGKTFSITTRNGVVFSGVSVSKPDGDAIRIQHDAGITNVKVTDLDAEARRLLAGNESLIEVIPKVLADNPSLVGSPEFFARTLSVSTKALAAGYLPLGALVGDNQAPGSARLDSVPNAGAIQKLADAYKKVMEQCALLLNLESELLATPNSLDEGNRASLERSLIENYILFGKVMRDQQVVVKDVSDALSLDPFYIYLDQLDGTMQGLERYIVKPRLVELQGGK